VPRVARDGQATRGGCTDAPEYDWLEHQLNHQPALRQTSHMRCCRAHSGDAGPHRPLLVHMPATHQPAQRAWLRQPCRSNLHQWWPSQQIREIRKPM
jgi:hypothetical protein